MKYQEFEVGGRINNRVGMANHQGQAKKPYREEKPKQKRKPDYAGARSQKRGEFND